MNYERLFFCVNTLSCIILFTFGISALAKPGDPCPDETLYSKPLLANINNFRSEAERKILKVFGQKENQESQVVFQDGAIALSDGGLAADHAALYYVVNPSSAEVVPATYQLVYYADAAGESAVGWLIPDDQSDDMFFKVTVPGLLATFPKEMTDAETEAIAEDLRRQFSLPVNTFSQFPGILSINWFKIVGDPTPDPNLENPEYVKSVVKAWQYLSNKGFVLEPDRTVARIPFKFESVKVVTTDSYDLNEARTVTKAWLKEGWFFTTCPSLPTPLGRGPIIRERPTTEALPKVMIADPKVEAKRIRKIVLPAPGALDFFDKELIVAQGTDLHYYDIGSPTFSRVRKAPLKLQGLGEDVRIHKFFDQFEGKKLILDVAPSAIDGMQTGKNQLIIYDPANETVHPLGKNLKSCVEVFGEIICEPIQFDQVAVKGSRIFVNAGGCNTVRYSEDLGESWNIVLGDAGDGGGSYPGYFGFKKGYLFSGGECPLDSAFIAVYEANDHWTKIVDPNPVRRIDVDFLSNRRVYFFQEIASSGRLFAGAEGALVELKGDSFEPQYRVRFETEGVLYPYFFGIAQSESASDVLVAYGSQHGGVSTLMLSQDGGTTWADITVKTLGDRNKQTVLKVVYDNKNKRFIIASMENFERPGPQMSVFIDELKI